MKLTQATSNTPVVTSSAVSRPGKGSPNFRRLRWWFVAALLPWALAGNSAESLAAVIAYDTASNNPPYVNNQTFIGLNGGTGFTAWTQAAGVATEAEVAFTNPEFVLFPSDTTRVEVRRSLVNTLAVGETFSILDFATQSGSGANDAGLELVVGGSVDAILEWDGDSWLWATFGTGSTGSGDSNISNTTLSSVSFTRTNTNAYSLTVSAGASSWITSGSFASASNTGLTAIYVSSQDGADVAFSTLQVVPEPSTYAMLFAGGMTAAGAAIRRRRRQAVSAS